MLLTTLAACAAPRTLVWPARMPAPDLPALIATLADLPLAAREAEVQHQFACGNVPTFLARLVPVRTTAIVAGCQRTATVWCTPDYFGLGDDGDWLRFPVTPQLAQSLADRLDCVLPTRKLVDAIWAAAPAQLMPQPFHPRDHDIVSLRLFAEHHGLIERQRAGRALGELVAGHKKDVVISSRLPGQKDRVAIYGWHRPDGRPIQPLWLGHSAGHVDYSHGVRFVHRAMEIDGRPTTVDAVLADPVLCVLLSDEGEVAVPRYQTR